MNTDYQCFEWSIYLLHIICYWWRNCDVSQNLYVINDGNLHWRQVLYYLNMEQSDCLNCFLTKTEVLMNWKRWSKNWQHRYCADNARSTTNQYVEQQYLCCHFFHQRFQSTKTPVFVRKHLCNRLAPYFLFSDKDLIKYLSSVLIPIIDVNVLTDVTITSSIAKNM